MYRNRTKSLKFLYFHVRFQKFTLHKLVRSYKYFCRMLKVLFLAFSDRLFPQDACIRKGISKIWIFTAFGGRQISSNVQISWFSRHSKLIQNPYWRNRSQDSRSLFYIKFNKKFETAFSVRPERVALDNSPKKNLI